MAAGVRDRLRTAHCLARDAGAPPHGASMPSSTRIGSRRSRPSWRSMSRRSSLSIPGAVFLTITGGILFGTLVGGAAVGGRGDHRRHASSSWSRAAPSASTWCAAPARCRPRSPTGFRADAFSYLLFLRLVPVFPFFLVNLAPALVGVKLRTFVAATALGIIPATLAFALFGAGLDSVIAAQEAAYRACLAAGRTDCRSISTSRRSLTPQLLARAGGARLIALVPVVVKRLRAQAGVVREAASTRQRPSLRGNERSEHGRRADPRHLRDRRRLRRPVGGGRGGRLRRAGGADREGQDGRRLPQLRLRAVEGAARGGQARRTAPRRAGAVRPRRCRAPTSTSPRCTITCTASSRRSRRTTPRSGSPASACR